MSRINTNVPSLLSQRILNQQNDGLTTALERLSTGLRINRGADDPAGLIASENLRAEEASIEAAIGNAERAELVVNIAEGGLQEINNLLTEVQSLVGQSANDAGLSLEEKEANQLQIDSILQTIDRISDTTSFQGTKLLNGTYDFTLENQATTVNEVKVNGAKIATDDQREVKVLVTQSAQNAGLFLSAGAATLDLSAPDATFVFDLAGKTGSREFSFASGATVTDIAETVNTFSELTGVSATVSGTGVRFDSIGLGQSEFVAVDIRDAAGQAGTINQLSTTDTGVATTAGAVTFAAANNPVRDEGQDVNATINGVAATTDGTRAKIASDFLDVEIDLTVAGAQATGSIDAVTITGGGASFNLGPNVDIGNLVSIGIGNVAARNLGSEENGYLNQLASGKEFNVVDGDLTEAQKIVNDAIAEVSTLRGRLGAFQKNTVGATIRSLGVALENTNAAESAIRDTDFAEEAAELSRSQILVQAATNILGISNAQPQSVLSLLG